VSRFGKEDLPQGPGEVRLPGDFPGNFRRSLRPCFRSPHPLGWRVRERFCPALLGKQQFFPGDHAPEFLSRKSLPLEALLVGGRF